MAKSRKAQKFRKSQASRNRQAGEPPTPSPATAPAQSAPTQKVMGAANPTTAQRDSIELIRLRGALGVFETPQQGFRQAAEGAPFLLRSLGLGAGLSSLAAKEGASAKIAELISAWLLTGCPHKPLGTQAAGTTAEHAIAAIVQADRATYRAAQIEAEGFATSLKRLAQALCPKEDDSDA